jgi:hypothetical protein
MKKDEVGRACSMHESTISVSKNLVLNIPGKRTLQKPI